MHERHSYRLIRDLFDHKEEIFGELKRASSQNHSLSAPGNPRPRAPSSTDESNRRANMEARNQAIMNRSRAHSPAPSATVNGLGHRRDKSTGAAVTRFPIQTSPPATSDINKRGMRHSLEVPDESPSNAYAPDTQQPSTQTIPSKPLPEDVSANGTAEHTVPMSSAPTDETRSQENNNGIEKQNSFGRSGRVAAATNRLNRKAQGSGSGAGLGMIARHAVKRDSVVSLGAQSIASVESERAQGVELSDKPMDF